VTHNGLFISTPMSFLRAKVRQLFQAMEFVNIDRMDELQRQLERRAAERSSHEKGASDSVLVRQRDFGDPRVVDFVAFARRTALRSSGQS
jgi:hypothetical protein